MINVGTARFNNSVRVAYLVQRFPSFTETFIMREMYWIREHDIELYIFSMLPPRAGPIHRHEEHLLPDVRYSPGLSWNVAKSQGYFLWNSPASYIRAFAKTIWQTLFEPAALLRALALFPKSVYFARQMKVLQVKHVHAHYAWLAGIAAGIASDLLRIPFTIHVHAFDLFAGNQRDVRIRLQNAAKIITISNYNADYINKLLPGANLEIVRCGVETERFRPKAQKETGKIVSILSVGRLIEKKGHEYLIDACALLVQRAVLFRCQIVGTGSLQESLQARIDRYQLHDKVVLVGALDEERVLELNQASDIFALPCVVSKDGDRDGLPVAMIEAMACGLPVIGTPVTGIPELLVNGRNGLLVNERDPITLAAALQELITNDSLRKTMGHNARETVIERFRIQDNTAKLAGIFREVMQQERRAWS